MIRRIKRILRDARDAKNRLWELYYQNVWRDATAGCDWIKDRAFTLTGGAANYSFMFLLFKVLDEARPQNILELGLGQTSKLTSQYVAGNPGCRLSVVEHNQEWIDVFSQKIARSDRANVHQKNLTVAKIRGEKALRYEALDDVAAGRAFDLVVVDGPFGWDSYYPRTNVLDLIPGNLAQNFVIILDDVERKGEQRTARLIFEKLSQQGISFRHSYRNGSKRQLLITGGKNEFLHWY